MKRPNDEAFRSLRRFVIFNIVGLLNTAADFIVFTLLQLTALHYLADQTIAYAAGAACSYLLNKRWTFGRKAAARFGEIARFAVVNLTSLAASLGSMYLLHDLLELPVLAAKAVTVVVTVAVNYAGMRLWVFREPEPGAGS